MSIKTNKSYSKRLKVTKNGKIMGRKAGQNHFNAKERGGTKGKKGRSFEIQIGNKSKSRYLVNVGN
ncbi:MAG: bL35 family ribosomal protein [Candidatus Paceibacterota bacterium]|jgi:ribosomal protein L35